MLTLSPQREHENKEKFRERQRVLLAIFLLFAIYYYTKFYRLSVPGRKEKVTSR